MLLRQPHRALVRLAALLASAAPALALGGAAEEGKLVATDAAANDFFGWAVDCSGDTVVAGARRNDAGGLGNAGTAYVFVRSGSGWSQEAKLVSSDADVGDELGWSVAVDGDTVVAGALSDDDAGSFTGAAYVFVRSGTTWSEEAKLVASDAAAGDYFGWSVSIDGDTVAVGAINDQDAGSASGAVYVFVRGGTTWSEEAKLTPADLQTGDEFGYGVAVSGDRVLVGSRCDDDPVFDAGSAYVFARSGTVWTEEQKLGAGDAASEDWFGGAVALSGGTAIVGAIRDDSPDLEAGAAYVFVHDGTSWSEQAKLLAGDGALGDNFGYAVGISGANAIVGSWLDDDGGTNSGAAYLYRRSGTAWSQTQKLVASDANGFDDFGVAVAIEGETGVVGAYLDDHGGGLNAGSAYAFRLPPGSSSFCDDADGSLTSCPCANPGLPDTGCDLAQATGGVLLELVAQETAPGNGATFQGTGFPAASAPAAIVIRATDLDPTAPVAFGDGLRCIGVPLVRLGAGFASGGVSTHAFGHGAMAGSGTFRYQLWFRNTPAMYCTPDAFNLSNGRSLVW